MSEIKTVQLPVQEDTIEKLTSSDNAKYEIWTDKLTKEYDSGKKKFFAVDHIDLRIEPGIHGFLGPNGAGKTTTINMLIGALSSTEGKAFIRGSKAGTVQSNQLIGFVPQDPQFYDDMTGEEYLIYTGTLGGLSPKKARLKAQELMEYFDIFNERSRLIGKYSGGMKQKIGLAAALIHDPKILILDEPTANLDPIGRQHIIEKIKSLSNKISVFVSSHILTEIEQMCQKVTMINHGKIIISDTIDSIKKMFIGNVFLLDTDKNKDILKVLNESQCINKAWIGMFPDYPRELIHIDPKNMEEFQRLIPRILYEQNAMLIRFSQPQVSLQDIFMELMDDHKEVA